MALPPHVKTDLVIGMTLAETFLLILFIVWYSQGAGSGPEWERIAKDRQTKINELREEIRKAQAKVDELERLRKWWRDNFAEDPPASMVALENALGTPQAKGLKQDMARGAPRCDQDNVLVKITVQYGTTVVRLKGTPRRLEEWGRSTGRKVPSAGDVLESQEAIAALLDYVRRFYDQRSQQKEPCRFDYELIWSTDEDYRRGRETFEKYFYPAGITAARDSLPALK